MSQFANHTICIGCWNTKNPESRVPHRLINVKEWEFCCYCGNATKAGIYVRGPRKEAEYCNCDEKEPHAA